MNQKLVINFNCFTCVDASLSPSASISISFAPILIVPRIVMLVCVYFKCSFIWCVCLVLCCVENKMCTWYKRYSKFLPCSKSKLNCFIGCCFFFLSSFLFQCVWFCWSFCILLFREQMHWQAANEWSNKWKKTAIYFISLSFFLNPFNCRIIARIAYLWHTLNEWWGDAFYVCVVCECTTASPINRNDNIIEIEI